MPPHQNKRSRTRAAEHEPHRASTFTTCRRWKISTRECSGSPSPTAARCAEPTSYSRAGIRRIITRSFWSSGRPKDLRLQPHQPDLVSRRFGRRPADDLATREGRAGRYRPAADGSRQRLVALFPRPRRQPPRSVLRYRMVHRAAVPRGSRPVAAGRANPRQVRCVLPYAPGFRPIDEYQAEIARKMGLSRP